MSGSRDQYPIVVDCAALSRSLEIGLAPAFSNLAGVMRLEHITRDLTFIAGVAASMQTSAAQSALAAMDYSEVWGNLNIASALRGVDLTPALAGVDFDAVSKALSSALTMSDSFERLTTDVFQNLSTISQSAQVASSILRSEELASAMADVEIELKDLASTSASDRADNDIPDEDAAGYIGVFGDGRELTNGEWAFLGVVVSMIGNIAMTTYRLPPDQAFATVVIAFVLITSLMSKGPRLF